MIDDNVQIKAMPLPLASLLASYLLKVRYGSAHSLYLSSQIYVSPRYVGWQACSCHGCLLSGLLIIFWQKLKDFKIKSERNEYGEINVFAVGSLMLILRLNINLSTQNEIQNMMQGSGLTLTIPGKSYSRFSRQIDPECGPLIDTP